MLLATTSKTLVYEDQVFCSTNTVNMLRCWYEKVQVSDWWLWRLVDKYVEMMGDPSLQPFLTGFVQISRYYVYILFSRCEHAASLNLQSAAHWGKTVSLCLPTSLDSLCLTLCTLLCSFCLPVLVNDGKVRAEGRCFAPCVITRWLELLEAIKCTHLHPFSVHLPLI